MNMTEQAIVGAIAIAISASLLWLGGKAFDQVDSFSTTITTVADDGTSPVLIEMARLDAERAELLARQHAQ
ncbi:hypothetical protein [Luteimonas sp. MC1750]|uniref:hypothetical protein n=1 Tax=Luteimonas sp. MC1750 TaxID=2799326 RepID=UPI0018F0D400|nr:hypothetical protein [Luteimonas sp. MC1750]MBJ6984027.1 hypothetical protein [Luteimonas sp. MC1750]QQO06839.1 hypothetical protein JGR68_05275 [Luteimonas sp. MC1750]